jgi:lipid II:glycine glycyltransferase (peptidoglycan interpeptide bridge formation enzyme)
MLVIDKKILTFNIKEAHFSDQPVDIENCDFLNFHYCKNKLSVDGFNRLIELTNVIDLTQDLDTIWNKMDNKNVRYWINRAQREGIKIHINQNYDEFYKIYQSFIKKKGIKSFFDMFGVWSTSLESMKKHGTLFIAEYNGEILAGTLYLEDDTYIEAWLGASKRLESDKKKKTLAACANRLLDWEVIKYAKNKGLKEFDLGGIWPEEETKKDIKKQGINNFKLGFGGETVTRYSYKKIYSKTYALLYHLYGLKNYRRKAAK